MTTADLNALDLIWPVTPPMSAFWGDTIAQKNISPVALFPLCVCGVVMALYLISKGQSYIESGRGLLGGNLIGAGIFCAFVGCFGLLLGNIWVGWLSEFYEWGRGACCS